MTTYRITDPATGRTLKLTGNAPPSADIIKQAFGSVPQNNKPGLSEAMGFVKQQMNQVSPLYTIGNTIQQGADVAGERTAEFLGSKNFNPNISATVGTLISMSPDIAMTAINPMASAEKTIPNLAISAERRALGFRIPELKTVFSRGQASKAAKVALQEGVTSATGNPDVLFNKANELALKTGQKLGNIREAVGPQPIQPVLNAIDDYASVRLQGATGGKWDQALKRIEQAKETVAGVAPGGTASLKRIAAAKKEIADSVNWLADNVSQRDAKGLAMAIEKGSERALAEAGGDIKTYKALKPIYSAAKSMIKGLNREIAAQEGNMAISLPALVAGASGAPGTALKIGGFELAKRRGAGIAASEIMSLANAHKTFGNAILPIANEAMNLVPEPEIKPTKSEAKEYKKRAKRKNPDLEGDALSQKAREMWKADKLGKK